jgi:hypothetical protein
MCVCVCLSFLNREYFMSHKAMSHYHSRTKLLNNDSKMMMVECFGVGVVFYLRGIIIAGYFH